MKRNPVAGLLTIGGSILFAFSVALTAASGSRSAAGPLSARASQSEQSPFSFTTIDFPNSVRTIADGVNPAGDIVGHYKDMEGKEHGFLLSAGQFTSIDFPGKIYTDARGISPGGDIVGTFKDAPGDNSNWHGYLLSKTTGAFTEIHVPGYLGSIAQRITPSGDIYGCTHDSAFTSDMRGFVRSADGAFTVLDVPSTMHNGATPNGRIIVGLYNDMTTGLRHGYFAVNGDFQPFDVPGSNWTEAWDINPRGEAVGDFRDSTGRFHGFVEWGGVFTTIDFPEAISTTAVGINPKGTIVGQFTDSSGHTHGFLALPAGE